MSHDVSMLRAKLRASMDKIGKTNGHAMPQSSSNIDGQLHELYVASEAQAYWKTRHDKAKAAALEVAMPADELQEIVDRVIKNNAGESVIAAEGELYTMTIDMSKPADRLDAAALRSHLRIECGLTPEQLDAAWNAATKQSSPAKRIKVLGR